jgi:hypothetical protein
MHMQTKILNLRFRLILYTVSLGPTRKYLSDLFLLFVYVDKRHVGFCDHHQVQRELYNMRDESNV